MKNILTAPFVTETGKTAANMYRMGFDERNSGNISIILDENEVGEYLDLSGVIRGIPLDFDAKALGGKILIVTASGSYFKNIADAPEENLGIVRISPDGKTAELLWGLKGGGRLTSEFPAHIMSHAARLSADNENRVVLHCHPTNILAMTFVHELDERKFTHTLWQMCTESIMIFPDGIGLLPWMVCGTNEIGIATAEKMKEFRLVIWAMHGIYGSGKTLDEAFGLIETAEKAAQVYMLTAHLPRVNTITDEQLRSLAESLKLDYREDFFA
ncbi:MAG: rhamnulose-1-phosphate aldolase [Oscillospiraceae bacterium]|nr:rhamnulose-1-phosphate aldolase [Oscillospiraceae bacterium]